MLGRWRVAIKQAEEARRAGRLDEAQGLVGQPDVRDHKQAQQLRAKLVADLLARAGRRAAADDLQGAIDDLGTAERGGAAPDALAAARLAAAEQVGGEIQALLDSGNPLQVIERVDALAGHKISGPALRRLREGADAWGRGIAEARRGEFASAREALDRAERLGGAGAHAAIDRDRRDFQRRGEALQPLANQLYRAMAEIRWHDVLGAADAILELAPEHAAAKDARTKAWQRVAAIPADPAPLSRTPPAAPAPASPRRGAAPAAEIRWLDDARAATIPAAAPAAPAGGLPPGAPLRVLAGTDRAGPSGRMLLWADIIGGYLICLDSRVTLGRASSDGAADIPILGDLSRRHATIVRDSDRYLIHAHNPTFVNGKRVDSAPLRDRDLIRMGTGVELRFRQPNPMSATARLELASRHRLPMAVSGILLMAETCVMGAESTAHVQAPHVGRPVVLYRQGEAIWCRSSEPFAVDGRPQQGRAPLSARSNVLGESFSFSLEPLDPQAALA
jgi:hypothetical protein